MIRVLDTQLARFELRTRMPFRYGIATMTRVPHVVLRARCEIDGRVQNGFAADHLPPKWFTKDPAREIAAEIDEMLRVIRHAAAAAGEVQAPTPFAFWRELYDRQSVWANIEHLPPLLAHFGTSLVERALLDAVARACAAPLHRLVRTDALGCKLDGVHSELASSRPSDWLPKVPLPRVVVRHTVGLADPLERADIAPEARCEDGLPQALLDGLRVYGLRHFKIKVAGQRDEDLARVERVYRLLAEQAPADFAVSIDGNEGFHSAAEFREFWFKLLARPGLESFARRLLFVEQPLSRSVALEASSGDWRNWPERPPIIIDESDAELDNFRRALDLGYAGTSHKNCKGVFKGIAHACRVAQLRRARPGSVFLMSGEDLSNIGPVALLQDLAVQAMLGVASVERNGHHYFAGLSFWPAEVQHAVLKEHPDLYTRAGVGWPRLDVRAGELQLDSVNAAPFGIAFAPDLFFQSSVADAPR